MLFMKCIMDGVILFNHTASFRVQIQAALLQEFDPSVLKKPGYLLEEAETTTWQWLVTSVVSNCL
ncbi:hypothetical protein DAI22_08g156400 [Oryza sativa Japonica Group]|nr:hypothetical protein DAI22_08g156400 [Oryza sativa Japonica Group]